MEGEVKTVELSETDERLVQIFKALGNPLRMGLVRYMAEHPQCITGDLVLYSNLAQSTVSEHLKVLREVGVVAGTVEGPAVCYCLNEDTLRWLREEVGRLTEELEACCATAQATSVCC
jgi:ArsR family transcriptional regulator, arsenate/arsenite/antimonite-responsive transcriptional repressor